MLALTHAVKSAVIREGIQSDYSMSNSSKTFLICHRGALGDFILTWPAILLLRKHFPEYKFIGLGRPDYMKLAIKLGILEESHDSDSALMADFFENGIIPEKLGNLENGVLWLKDAGKTAELLKKNSNCAFAPIEPFPSEKIHVAKFHGREILKYLKIKESFNPTALTPEYSGHPSNIIYIHPGSGSPKKNYSPEFYLRVAKFAEIHFKRNVKFILGPVEMENGLSKFFPANKTVIPENASALADILSGAFFFIGNDSGAGHLSGFLGIPTIALYKDTDPETWGIIGRKVKWIEGADENMLLKKLTEFFLLKEHF
jgi:ADP-heptose:LPS heptosyltransferase